MIHRETARKVWAAICNHDGFAEDRGEWQDCCDVTDYELIEFEAVVSDAIAELPSITEEVPEASKDASSDTLEKVALDMLGEIEVCELDNNGWWHHYYDFRDRLKALGVMADE